VLPALAAEDAVVTDARLHVMALSIRAQAVWPTAQMSSFSPSTVNNAVQRIAPGSTR
jgi:hypothetical protein